MLFTLPLTHEEYITHFRGSQVHYRCEKAGEVYYL